MIDIVGKISSAIDFVVDPVTSPFIEKSRPAPKRLPEPPAEDTRAMARQMRYERPSRSFPRITPKFRRLS